MKEFKILKEARKYDDLTTRGTDGYIVEYEGDLYFVYKEKYVDIYSDEIWSWAFDIERKFCFEEVNEDSYRYYDSKNNRITFEK